MSDTEFPLPPPTFEILTTSLKMQVEMHLGLMHFGDEKDRPKPELRLARHSIDMLAMLEEKTRGNLTLEEKRLLENTLTELRFRYIHVLEHSQKETAGGERAEPEGKANEGEAKEEQEHEGQAGSS